MTKKILKWAPGEKEIKGMGYSKRPNSERSITKKRQNRNAREFQIWTDLWTFNTNGSTFYVWL